jgi:DNA repair protein RecO (recombination protein O)
MSFLTTKAVILKKMNLGESDKLVTFLTREAGIVKAIAKGAVKSRKRFGGVLETGSHVEIRVFIKKKTSLHRLEAVDLVEPYTKLSGEPKLFAAASHLLELTAAYAEEGVSDPRQFVLLTSSLRGLCSRGFDERILRIFELRTLAYAGIAPNFDACPECNGLPPENRAVAFSIPEGTIRCLRHEGDPDLPRIPPSTRNLFSAICHVGSKELAALEFTANDLKIAKRLLPAFCQYQLSRKLRSLALMETIA